MSLLNLIKEFFGIGEVKPSYTPGISLGPLYGKILKQKLSSGSRLGVTYIEPYVQKPEHLSDREIDGAKRIIKSMGFEVGVHAADLPLTSADKDHYDVVQNTLEEYIKRTSKFDSQHVLFHSSSQIRPRYRERGAIEMKRALLIDHEGELINEKILKEEKTREWFKDEWAKDRVVRFRRQEIEERINSIVADKIETKEEITRAEAERLRRQVRKENLEEIVEELAEEEIDDWDCWGTELRAFDIMAHWMHYTEDKLWRKIADGKDPKNVEEENRDAAVSAKYLQGHLKKIKGLANKKNVKILIENAHDVRGSTEYVRLYKPEDVYWAIKTVNHSMIRMCLDFEHMVIHGLTPEEEIKNYPGDFGKLLNEIHICDPSPAHTHKPLLKGNAYVYDLLWRLREKGFEEGKILFEPGGEEQEKRVLESVNVIKEMIKFLSMEVHTDDLPDEYYGITPQEMEHEKRVIESHAFDPLKGLIHSPELTDTLFGREMARRGRRELEKWAREEWR